MKPTVLVIAGPTASGKSAVALEIAQRWNGVIVSADAMQVYRRMDVGTASPSKEELDSVQHFGIDILEPHEAFSAAAFLDLVDAAIASGKPVIVAGGTSMYLRALVRGLAKTPPVDARLRETLGQREDLHAALASVDPALAARLHPNDTVRILRGLEVFEQSGRTLSSIQEEHEQQPPRLHTVGVWLDRTDLYERIDSRVHSMMDRGYVQEVEALLASGVDRHTASMKTLGYRYLCDHLLDGFPLDEATRLTMRDTRHFARKQRNWRKHLGFPEVRSEHLEAGLLAAQRAFGAAP